MKSTIQISKETKHLKAVIGARTAKENLLFDSLEEACSINADMKIDLKKSVKNKVEEASFPIL